LSTFITDLISLQTRLSVCCCLQAISGYFESHILRVHMSMGNSRNTVFTRWHRGLVHLWSIEGWWSIHYCGFLVVSYSWK